MLICGICEQIIRLPVISRTLFMDEPEAHTYLKYEDNYFDFTKKASSPDHFVNDLLFETEIQPNEINRHKIRIHRTFLAHWLTENNNVSYSFDEIWEIRERCIQALSE